MSLGDFISTLLGANKKDTSEEGTPSGEDPSVAPVSDSHKDDPAVEAADESGVEGTEAVDNPSPEDRSEETVEGQDVAEVESDSAAENPATSSEETEPVPPLVPKEDKPVEELLITNPMRKVDYAYPLAEILGDEKVLSVAASDQDGDLAYDEEAKALKGCPLTSREFWVEIELPDKVLRFKCFVNENPRLLWKDIPSDQVVKPDKDYLAILTPTVDMVAVSHRGRSHANRGTYRDDDFYLGKEGKFTLSIVADGAGSAPLSSTGSKVFCQTAGLRFAELVAERQEDLLEILEDLQHHPSDVLKDPKMRTCLYEIFPTTAHYGLKVLTKMAEDNGVPLKYYHTTALFSMTVQIEPESYFCAAFQIGDGITVALTDQHLELMGEGDSGNFPGETVFVTSNGVFDEATALFHRIRCFFTKAKPTVISMTDGITDSYFKTNPKLDNLALWQQLITDVTDDNGRLKPVCEICDWLNYYIDQEHDDRTMSIVVHK